jgi:hypothetical protein
MTRDAPWRVQCECTLKGLGRTIWFIRIIFTWRFINAMSLDMHSILITWQCCHPQSVIQAIANSSLHYLLGGFCLLMSFIHICFYNYILFQILLWPLRLNFPYLFFSVYFMYTKCMSKNHLIDTHSLINSQTSFSSLLLYTTHNVQQPLKTNQL